MPSGAGSAVHNMDPPSAIHVLTDDILISVGWMSDVSLFIAFHNVSIDFS